ncbi:MAG: ECF-type sigma factor [Acidobacteriota bacterium]
MKNDSISPGDVTVMLERWRSGDRAALDSLLPQVYGEIRSLADRLLGQGGRRPTFQSTELANEVLLRFLGSGAQARDRLHFFALTAHSMRNILVDRHRRRAAAKRGHAATHVTLGTGSGLEWQGPVDLIDLDRALGRFSEVAPRAAQIVELRFFTGLTNDEVAEVLDISVATVTREWRAARLWLADALDAPNGPAGGAGEA